MGVRSLVLWFVLFGLSVRLSVRHGVRRDVGQGVSGFHWHRHVRWGTVVHRFGHSVFRLVCVLSLWGHTITIVTLMFVAVAICSMLSAQMGRPAMIFLRVMWLGLRLTNLL